MKFLNMERRQKYIEEILKRQQRQIFKISKELEIHREFLNLQFESFMDYLFQNGGQIIQVSNKNGQGDETGVFFPMKKDQNGDAKQDHEDNEEEDDVNEREDEDKDPQQTALEEEDDGEREDIMEELPPPQAILGSPSADDLEGNDQVPVPKKNFNEEQQFRGQSSSRRSSHNVVSSSVAQNGDEDEEYDDLDEYESAQPEVMKYDMNHFMFSHFMDGNGEDNDMDESYNDNDEEGGMYEDNEEIMDLVNPRRSLGSSRQWSNSSVGRNSSIPNLQQMAGKSNSNNHPVPASNIPHNERTCRYCGKTFHWKQSWVIHERTHTGEKPYLCKCGKAFSQKSNMNTHAKSCSQSTTIQKGSTTVYQMSCSHCKKMFTHKKNLDLHVEKFHPEVLNLSVKNSNSSSSSPSSSFHLNGSAMMEAELAAAAKRAAENAAILQILKNVNSAQSQVTTNNGNNTSMTTHSGSLSPSINHNSNSNSSMSGGDDRNGRYPCHYCPKRFPVKGTLERHLRVHTGEKPFMCGVCGKAFTQKGSVKLHLERVHRQTM